MTFPPHYAPQENQRGWTIPAPKEGECLWLCECGDDDSHIDFLEVHLSGPGDKMVFRVSNRDQNRGVRLGECAILGVKKVMEVRDLLNAYLEYRGHPALEEEG